MKSKEEILGLNDLFIEQLFNDLFPIMRSITGPGFRKTALLGLDAFKITSKELKIPSGSKVFDWTVPAEWDVSEAWVKNSKGKTIIDVNNSNIELLNFSSSFKGTVSKVELLSHLYSLPDHPDWIPYRTSYYRDDWGFSCKHSLISSSDFVEPFEVNIETTKKIKNGNLYWYEAEHKGTSRDTILISTYICHPSLANDNLSGFISALALFSYIKNIDTRLTYKLIIVPETIGALAFLKSSRRRDIRSIVGGFVVTTTAGNSPIGIKKTFLGNHWLDKISTKVSQELDSESFVYEFSPFGSDERQYSSPEFRIPTISITNAKYHEYDEYHTSADNLDYISISNFKKNLKAHIEVVNRIEKNVIPQRKTKSISGGEFQLSNHGLFPTIGGRNYQKSAQFEEKQVSENRIAAYAWLMHLTDGKTSLLEMAEKSGLPFELLSECIEDFKSKGLVKYL